MSRRRPKIPLSRKERAEILGRVRMIGILLAETETIIGDRWPRVYIGDKWHRVKRSFRILSEDMHEIFGAEPPGPRKGDWSGSA